MERSQNATKVLIGALVLLVAVVAVVLIARSGGDDGSSTGSISTDISKKPAIPVPSAAPPTGLESHDIVEGDALTEETIVRLAMGVKEAA